MIGGAFFVSAGQCAFGNQLVQSLALHAPDVNPGLALSIGATDIRTFFSGSTLAAVLRAYLDGLHSAYALAVAAMGVAAVISFAAEWKKINIEAVMKGEVGEVEAGDKGGITQSCVENEGK